MKTDKTVPMMNPETKKLERVPIHSYIITIRMGDKSLAQFMRLAVKYRISIQDSRMESIFDNPNIKLGYRYAQFLFFIPETYIEPFKAEIKHKLHEPGNFTVPTMDDDRWMCLVDGSQFFPFDPDPKTIKIGHIAHCLANLCRYAGHTKRFYSVAEHAYWLSYAVPKEHALAALLHDASEAYCNDLPSPIKRSLPEYQRLENRIQLIIAKRFMLDYPFHEEIHLADKRILANEYRDILNPCVINWVEHIEPLPDITIQGWLPDEAKRNFFMRWLELKTTYRFDKTAPPKSDKPIHEQGITPEELAYQFHVARRNSMNGFGISYIEDSTPYDPSCVPIQMMVKTFRLLQEQYNITRKQEE